MYYYLSLGSNLGEREQLIRHALKVIELSIGHVLRCSSYFYSAPWGFQSEHEFCNICCAVESSLSPLQVLHSTQAIERAMGRTKKSETINPESETVLYSDRCIDIDIIRVFDGEKELFVDLPELHIPHLLWQERDFVKVPLAEIMPV